MKTLFVSFPLSFPFSRSAAEKEKREQHAAEKKIQKEVAPKDNLFFSVRRMRLELTRSCDHYPLKVACIPISPPALAKCKKT